jgi:hypothetical protein
MISNVPTPSNPNGQTVFEMLIRKFPAVYLTRKFSSVFVYKVWSLQVESEDQFDVCKTILV